MKTSTYSYVMMISYSNPSSCHFNHSLNFAALSH